MSDLDTVQAVFVWLLVACGVLTALTIAAAMLYRKGREDAEADLVDCSLDDPLRFEQWLKQMQIEETERQKQAIRQALLKNRAETLGEASASSNANPEPVRGRHLNKKPRRANAEAKDTQPAKSVIP